VLFAHGDLSIRIELKTKEIKKDGHNSELYYERGVLYQQHIEYKKAIKDYKKAKTLGSDNRLLNFKLSEAYYESKKYKKALGVVMLCFGLERQNVNVYKLKARILFKLGRYKETMVAYKYVVDNTIDIRPEAIIEYSTIILTIDSLNYKGALEAIELGLEKVGRNTVTFQLKKIEYLKKSHQVDAVLAQYNQLIKNSARKEFWYYEKGKYQNNVDRNTAANISLQQAKMAIQLLPLKFKNTIAIKKLQTQINELEKLMYYD
jgi:tetratricopeptide (TPR) repeat protein